MSERGETKTEIEILAKDLPIHTGGHWHMTLILAPHYIIIEHRINSEDGIQIQSIKILTVVGVFSWKHVYMLSHKISSFGR